MSESATTGGGPEGAVGPRGIGRIEVIAIGKERNGGSSGNWSPIGVLTKLSGADLGPRAGVGAPATDCMIILPRVNDEKPGSGGRRPARVDVGAGSGQVRRIPSSSSLR